MRPAGESLPPGPAPGAIQMPAAYPKRCIDEEVPTGAAQTPEPDPLGVPQQPGGFMVPGAGVGLEGRHPEGDVQRMALLAGGLAGGGMMHGANLILPATPHFRVSSLCL